MGMRSNWTRTDEGGIPNQPAGGGVPRTPLYNQPPGGGQGGGKFGYNLKMPDAEKGILNMVDQSASLNKRGLKNFLSSSSQANDSITSAYGDSYDMLGAGYQGAGQAINQGYGAAIGGFDPYAKIGMQGFQDYAYGSTPQGYGQNIMALTGAAQPLVDQRMNIMQRAQGGLGLSRSGFGMNEMADLPMEVLMGLEQQMSGRQRDIGQTGYGAQQGISGLQQGEGDIMAQLMQQYGQQGAGIRTQYGSDAANLKLGEGSNILQLMSMLGAQGLEAEIARKAGKRSAGAADKALIGSALGAAGQIGGAAAGGG